jgi:hypothetical protein
VLGQQFVGSLLNRTVGSMLDSGVATKGGVRDGLVAVNYAAVDAASQGIVSQSYLFDEENTLQRLVAEMKVPGPMGEMKVSLSQAFTWKPMEGTDGKLISATQVIDTDLGFMKQKGTVTFDYRELAGIVLLVRISKVSELPAMMGGGEQTQVLEVKNLVLNGTAVADAAGARPAGKPEPAGG